VKRPSVRKRSTCYAFVVSTDSQFVQGFLLASLAAIAAGAILAFFFGGLKWSYKRHLLVTLPLVLLPFVVAWIVTTPAGRGHRLIMAGTIVDESSDEPIGQAVVSLADGSVRGDSEDNGNFRLDLTGRASMSQSVRIKVTKNGYLPVDAVVGVPTEDFIVKLHHL
jgi:hypothetical protein